MTAPGSASGLRKAADADLHPSTPVAAADEPIRFGKLSSTADAVGGPDRDKLVDLDVKVPKSLRKALKSEAARRGIPLDALVAEALRDRTVR